VLIQGLHDSEKEQAFLYHFIFFRLEEIGHYTSCRIAFERLRNECAVYSQT